MFVCLFFQEGLAEKQLANAQKEHNSKKTSGKESSVIVKLFRGFKKPTGYKPLFILVVLFFFQQYAGIYITIFYAVTFFDVSDKDFIYLFILCLF